MDARSGFLAVVLVALVAALAPRLEAREVRATEVSLRSLSRIVALLSFFLSLARLFLSDTPSRLPFASRRPTSCRCFFAATPT